MKNKNMIFIYDVFTDVHEERFKLNPYDLYLYCFLYRNRSHDYTVNLSVDTIHKCMGVRFHNSIESKNRQMIKDTLMSLENKGIIEFDYNDSLNTRAGNSIGLSIKFQAFADKKGFIQLPYNEFDEVSDICHFYMRVAVERFNNVMTASRYGGRWISEKEFGDLLGVSKRTFRNYADDMIEKNKLYRQSGTRKENGKEQDKNIYKTVPFGYEDDVKDDIEYDPETELNTVDGQHTVSDLKEFAQNSSWGQLDEYGGWQKIEYDDYKWYRIIKEYRIDKKFALKCENIKKKIGEEKFNEYEERYLKEKNEINF